MYGITIGAFGGSSDELGQGLDLGHQFSFTCCEECQLLFRASAMCCFSLSLSGTYVQHLLAWAVKVLVTSDLVCKGVMGGVIQLVVCVGFPSVH